MASSFQQQSRVRKMVYGGLIIGLITVSMLFRKFSIEPLAYRLQLKAEAQGEVGLTTSALRLTLLGSRGLVSTILWQMAMEKMKRHQWNELDMYVTSITNIQPNFVTPWLFQSWNLAYNVAVECDLPRDKYYYISRGVQLLAEGERRHQGTITTDDNAEQRFPGNPDMRFNIGHFMQMKIGLSDEKNTMRCLFDLSCIDPRDWSPDYLLKADKHTVDLERFEKFCHDHPRLVRRLREKLRLTEPTDVIAFFKDNWGLPSRFSDEKEGDGKAKLADRMKQFPILPPARVAGVEYDPNTERFDHPAAPDLDVFLACHYWYVYAQEPLPPLPAEPYMGVNEPDYHSVEYRTKYRFPKMMLEIFRGYPARALEYYADDREKYEGWFDDEGWKIDRWFDDIPDKAGQVVVGRESKYRAAPAWQKAFEWYEQHGITTGQLISPQKYAKLDKDADLYREKYRPSEDLPIIKLNAQQRAEMNGKMGESFDAHQKLNWYRLTRYTTQFVIHYDLCAVERFPDVVSKRWKLYDTQKKVTEQFDASALKDFRDALEDWQGVLLRNPQFRDLEEIQTETYEVQWKYLYRLQMSEKDKLTKIIQGVVRLGSVSPLAPQPAALVNDILMSQKGDSFRLDGTSPLDIAKVTRPQMKIVPMRNMVGPLEQVYFVQGEAAEKWMKELSALDFAFSAGPKLAPLIPEKTDSKSFTIIQTSSADPLKLDKEWQPLLDPDLVHVARAHLRLEEAQPRAPKNLPPIPPTIISGQ